MDTLAVNVAETLDLIFKKHRHQQRILVGVTGPPGSGKSTLAEAVVAKINSHPGYQHQAALLPMDGFHLDNATLQQQQLMARKGAPNTFDVNGFIDLLLRVKSNHNDIHYPLFDRARDCSLADAGLLKKDVTIVVVEGNYLLLDVPQWNKIMPLLDTTIFLKPALKTLESRLLQRWLDLGYTPADAEAKAYGNDLINAKLVLDTSLSADLTINH